MTYTKEDAGRQTGKHADRKACRRESNQIRVCVTVKEEESKDADVRETKQAEVITDEGRRLLKASRVWGMQPKQELMSEIQASTG